MFAVIKATILSYLRRRKSLVFNLVFPIFLVILLGAVLSNMMDDDVAFSSEEIKVYYLDEGSDDSKESLEILKSMSDEMNLVFEEVNDLEDGKAQVRINKAVLVHLDGDEIDYYSNDKSIVASSSVFAALNSIIDGYNTTLKLYEIDPEAAVKLVGTNDDDFEKYFNSEKIAEEKTPSASGYYGVAELGLMIFYFIHVPIYEVYMERVKSIKSRILLSGVSRGKYYLAKFIGSTIVCYISILISYLVLKYGFNIEYGDNNLIMPLALLTFVALAVAIGIVFAMITKGNKKAETVLSAAVIPVMCLLGGGYVALGDDLGTIGNILTRISPLRTFNRGVLNSIYLGNYDNFRMWIIGSTAVTVLILIIIVLISRKEEVVNG